MYQLRKELKINKYNSVFRNWYIDPSIPLARVSLLRKVFLRAKEMHY